jgi:inner membrane protease ATP23
MQVAKEVGGIVSIKEGGIAGVTGSNGNSGLPPLPRSSQRKCEELVASTLANSPRVHVLLSKMRERGCAAANAALVSCEDIFGGAAVAGGFDPVTSRVIMNPRVPASHLSAGDFTRALTHELVHAFDSCRAVVDPDRCAHIACTEIRAANLSGDCDFFAEAQRMPLRLFTGGGGLAGRQRECVRRRAELSLSMHAPCRGDDGRGPARHVAHVWEPCYADAEPFASN